MDNDVADDNVSEDRQPQIDLSLIHAAMMEELGVGRKDTLPLEDKVSRGQRALPEGSKIVNKDKKSSVNRGSKSVTSGWHNIQFNDVDPAVEGLDSMYDGQLYRLRRGAGVFEHSPHRRGHDLNSTARGRQSNQTAHAAGSPIRGGGSNRGSHSSTVKARGGHLIRVPAEMSGQQLGTYRSNSRGISSATPKTFFNDGRRSTANTHARIDAAVAHLSAIGQQFQNNNEVAPKARPATAHGNSQQTSVRRPAATSAFSLASPEVFLAHFGFTATSTQNKSGNPSKKSIIPNDSADICSPHEAAALDKNNLRGDSSANPATDLSNPRLEEPTAASSTPTDPRKVASRVLLCSADVRLDKSGSSKLGKVRLIKTDGEAHITLEIEVNHSLFVKLLLSDAVTFTTDRSTLTFQPGQLQLQFGLPYQVNLFEKHLRDFKVKNVTTLAPIVQVSRPTSALSLAATRSVPSTIVTMGSNSFHDMAIISGEPTLISFSDDEDEAIAKPHGASPSSFEEDLWELLDDNSVAETLKCLNDGPNGSFLHQVTTLVAKTSANNPIPEAKAFTNTLASSKYDEAESEASEEVVGSLLRKSEYILKLPPLIAEKYIKAFSKKILRKVKHDASQVTFLGSTIPETGLSEPALATQPLVYSIQQLLDIRSQALPAMGILLSKKMNLNPQAVPFKTAKPALVGTVLNTTRTGIPIVAGKEERSRPSKNSEVSSTTQKQDVSMEDLGIPGMLIQQTSHLSVESETKSDEAQTALVVSKTSTSHLAESTSTSSKPTNAVTSAQRSIGLSKLDGQLNLMKYSNSTSVLIHPELEENGGLKGAGFAIGPDGHVMEQSALLKAAANRRCRLTGSASSYDTNSTSELNESHAKDSNPKTQTSEQLLSKLHHSQAPSFKNGPEAMLHPSFLPDATLGNALVATVEKKPVQVAAVEDDIAKPLGRDSMQTTSSFLMPMVQLETGSKPAESDLQIPQGPKRDELISESLIELYAAVPDNDVDEFLVQMEKAGLGEAKPMRLKNGLASSRFAGRMEAALVEFRPWDQQASSTTFNPVTANHLGNTTGAKLHSATPRIPMDTVVSPSASNLKFCPCHNINFVPGPPANQYVDYGATPNYQENMAISGLRSTPFEPPRLAIRSISPTTPKVTDSKPVSRACAHEGVSCPSPGSDRPSRLALCPIRSENVLACIAGCKSDSQYTSHNNRG